MEGLYDGVIGGTAFLNETRLTFSQRSMTIFIQTDKPIYMQGQEGNYIYFFNLVFKFPIRFSSTSYLKLERDIFVSPFVVKNHYLC